VLIDPDNPGLGHRAVVRWNSPDQWIISRRTTHPALITEEEFIAVQDLRAGRSDARHVYLLTGLLRCAMCGRTSAATPGAHVSKNAYVRESQVLARLPLLYLLLTADKPAAGRRPTASALTKSKTLRPEEVIESCANGPWCSPTTPRPGDSRPTVSGPRASPCGHGASPPVGTTDQEGDSRALTPRSVADTYRR